MSWSIGSRALAIGLITLVPATLAGQEVSSLQVGISAPSDTVTSPVITRPSSLSLGVKSVGLSAAGAMAGFLVGNIVDYQFCMKRHGHEQGFIFGPCAFYASYGTAIGWFGGAVLGATSRAAHIARKRGCPRSTAIARAFAGSLLGALPGIVVVAPQPGRYPAAQSALIFGAPILAGAGGAVAVMACHS